MNELIFISNRALYLILALSAVPILVATVVGILVGLIQTITQIQEQTLPFGIKLLCVVLCLFLVSGWYSEILLAFARQSVQFAFSS